MRLADTVPIQLFRSSHIAVAALIAAAVFLAFLPALSAGFVNLDDQDLILNNPHFRGLTSDHLGWMFSTTLLGHYQPLTWLSYAIDYSAVGLEPRQFHLTSVLVHAANSVLVFLLLHHVLTVARRARAVTPWAISAAAAAGALFWGVHPLRAESVAWVTERRDVLSGFFMLLALLAYMSSVEPGIARLRSRGRYITAIVLLAASLLSKAWGMSFFVTVLLLDIWPLGRLPLGVRQWFSRPFLPVLVQKLPFATLGIAAAAMAAHAQSSATGAVRTLAEWPLSARIPQGAYGLVYYVWKTISPTDLAPRVELPEHVNPLGSEYLICYALIAAAAIAVLALARRFPWLAVGIIIYVVTVSPVLGFLQSGDQFVADRYSYLACIPWSGFLAGGLVLACTHARTSGKRSAFITAAGAGVVWVAALLSMTRFQAATWHDPFTLWSHAAEVVPSSGALTNYALALKAAGRRDEAVARCREAVALRDSDGRAWFTLANLLRDSGDAPGAEGAYKRAALHMPQAYMAWVNLGTLIQSSRPDEAIECFRAAVADLHRPRAAAMKDARLSGVPCLALAAALARRGDVSGARQALEEAVTFDDTRIQAQTKLKQLAIPSSAQPAPSR